MKVITCAYILLKIEPKRMKNKEHKNHYSEFMRKIFSSLVARLQCIKINGTVKTLVYASWVLTLDACV